MRENEYDLQNLYNNAIPLKITGIIKPNEDADATMLSGSIAYTHLLTEHVVNKSKNSPIINAQLNSPDKDIITGLPFKTTTGTLSDEEKATALKEYVAKLDVNGKATVYSKILRINAINQKIQ